MFTKKHTAVCKGAAIVLLLFHHLFYSPQRGPDIVAFFLNKDGVPLIRAAAVSARVCVPIFLILSGIGIYRKMEKMDSSMKDQFKSNFNSLLKLMLNFWCVFLVFVPLAVYRGAGVLYGENHVARNVVLDFLGLSKLFNTPSINGAWWYLSIVIFSYILAPILYYCIKKQYLIVLASALLMLLGNGRLYLFQPAGIVFILYNLTFFVIGMCLASENVIDNLILKMSKLKSYTLIIGGGLFTLGGYFLKNRMNGIGDVYFAIIIILFVAVLGTRNGGLEKILSFLGKYSANIFFLHTFLYYKVFLYDFLYGFRYPIIIFMVMLAISLGCAILIEMHIPRNLRIRSKGTERYSA